MHEAKVNCHVDPQMGNVGIAGKTIDAVSYDVTVIGAGIIGTTIAESLQHQGRKVLLVDRLGVGEGCSKGNAGACKLNCVTVHYVNLPKR